MNNKVSAEPGNYRDCRTIKPEFRKNGFNYRLLHRHGNIVLYLQSKGDSFSRYEVLRVQTVKTATEFHQPGDEYLPGTGSWGTLGWTYGTLESAQQKFEELVYRYEPETLKTSRR